MLTLLVLAVSRSSFHIITERLRLLIHILRKLGRFNITSEKLQEVAQDSKRQLRPEESMEDKMEILNEIFKVRRLEERFERGEVGTYFDHPWSLMRN